MMDAEIARCERVASGVSYYVNEDHCRSDMRALLEALKQARKEAVPGRTFDKDVNLIPAAEANAVLHESNARGWKMYGEKCGEADRLLKERDAVHALLREAVPHIKRSSTPYKDGWIEEKESILSRIAVVLGDAP